MENRIKLLRMVASRISSGNFFFATLPGLLGQDFPDKHNSANSSGFQKASKMALTVAFRSLSDFPIRPAISIFLMDPAGIEI